MTTLNDLNKLNAAFCSRPGWYLNGLFWRDVDGEWVVRERGEKTNGKGDLISNTCMKIIFHENKTKWAYASLEACKELLLAERRWPERMDQDCDSKSRLDKWGKMTLWFFDIREFKPYRWPNNMTRDPYIFFYCACIFLGKEEYIEEVKPPRYVWSLGFFDWRKSLFTEGYNTVWYKQKKSHRFFYVTRLREFQAWAYEQKKGGTC